MYNYLQLISNSFGKLNLSSEIQQADFNVNNTPNFHQQSLPLDLQSNHIMEDNGIHLYNTNFNSVGLNVEGNNTLNYTGGLNQNVTKQLIDQVHPSVEKFRTKKEMVNELYVKIILRGIIQK